MTIEVFGSAGHERLVVLDPHDGDEPCWTRWPGRRTRSPSSCGVARAAVRERPTPNTSIVTVSPSGWCLPSDTAAVVPPERPSRAWALSASRAGRRVERGGLHGGDQLHRPTGQPAERRRSCCRPCRRRRPRSRAGTAAVAAHRPIAHRRGCRTCPSSPATILSRSASIAGTDAAPVGDLERHPAVVGDASGLLDLLPGQSGGLLATGRGYRRRARRGRRRRGDPSGPLADAVRPPGGEQIRERRVHPVAAAPQGLSGGREGPARRRRSPDRRRPPSRRVERAQVHAPIRPAPTRASSTTSSTRAPG